jgi:hypothetical protein
MLWLHKSIITQIPGIDFNNTFIDSNERSIYPNNVAGLVSKLQPHISILAHYNQDCYIVDIIVSTYLRKTMKYMKSYLNVIWF